MQFGPLSRDLGMKVAVAGSTGSVKAWGLTTSSAAGKVLGLSGPLSGTAEQEEGKVIGVVGDSDEEERKMVGRTWMIFEVYNL